MKIEVNHEACIGCRMCIAIDEENFTFDDEGYVKPINHNITNKTYEAKDCCPVEAINIIEKEK